MQVPQGAEKVAKKTGQGRTYLLSGSHQSPGRGVCRDEVPFIAARLLVKPTSSLRAEVGEEIIEPLLLVEPSVLELLDTVLELLDLGLLVIELLEITLVSRRRR